MFGPQLDVLFAATALHLDAAAPQRPWMVRDGLRLTPPYWIRTSLLTHQLRVDDTTLDKAWRPLFGWCNLRRLFICPGEISGRRRPLSESVKWDLFREIVAGVPPEATSLYRAVQDGRKVVGRRGGPAERHKTLDKVPLQNLEDVTDYYRRQQALVEVMRRDGRLRPVSELCPGDPYVRRGKETDIGIAIVEDGQPLLFRKGRHRLAAAHALGLEEVPCTPLLVSARWLRSLAGGRVRLREAGRALDGYLRSLGSGNGATPSGSD